MDTRSKILTLAAAAELAGPLIIVTGTFDVLRAGHARELRAARERAPASALLVVVLPSPLALMEQRARAEMVAALRVVDYVVTAHEDDLLRLGCAHPGAEMVRLEAADARRVRQLIEHVRSRTNR